MRRRYLLTAMLTLAACVAWPAGSASAGRLLVTGHDADFHCASENRQCHYVEVAVRYVRAGSSKPVLVLDRGDLDFVRALDTAFGPGRLPRVVMDPRGSQFRTASLSRFSAILIASDINCGGCDLNESGFSADTPAPDSRAINRRKADIARFFNAGGGIYANAGATHGDGNPDNGADVYYAFAPLPVGGVPVSPPFRLTAVGRRLGFRDSSNTSRSDINCCQTHNSFRRPRSGSRLQVAEVDREGFAETLVASGRISGGEIVGDGPGVSIRGVPGRCTSSSFTVTVRGSNGATSVSLYLDGRRVGTGDSPLSVRINARRLRAGRHRLTAVARDRQGRTGRRTATFSRCGEPDFTGRKAAAGLAFD